MKRVAESQLTKDVGDNDDEAQEMGTGIHKADPSVLGARKMKGLPRRGLAAGASPSAPSPPATPLNGLSSQPLETTSRFGAFTGFGGSGAPPAFTFTPPSQSTALNNVPKRLSPPSSASLPPVPAPASQNLFSSATPSNPTPPSTPPLTSDAQNQQDAALKYCTALRGVNSSFLDAVTKAVQADPFADITELLDRYKSHRLSIQKEFDSRMSAPGLQTTLSSLPLQGSSSKPPPFMPAPPKSFLGFGAGQGAAISAAPGKGFTPKIDSSSTGLSTSFSFSTEKPSPFSNTTPASDKASSGGLAFAFAKADSTTSTAPSGTPVLSAGSSPVSAFTFSDSDKPLEKGSISTFSFKPSASTVPFTPGFSSFLSPSKAANTSISPPPLGLSSPSPPSPSAFGFGAAKHNASASSFGSFGKGSIGNPVGFAFGSPTATPGVIEPSNPVETYSSKTSMDGVPGADSVADGTLSAAPDSSHDPSPAPSQGSSFDANGPGEEDETTLHETRARAYKLTLTEEKKEWVTVGSGQLKLKAHADLTRRRILMRNSSTGQVILNFNLFPGFQVTTDQKAISFRVPGDSDAAAVYRVKVLSDSEAVKWQDTIRNEVDNLGASDDS